MFSVIHVPSFLLKINQIIYVIDWTAGTLWLHCNATGKIKDTEFYIQWTSFNIGDSYSVFIPIWWKLDKTKSCQEILLACFLLKTNGLAQHVCIKRVHVNLKCLLILLMFVLSLSDQNML